MVYKNVRFWVFAQHVYVVIICGTVCLQIKLVLPYAAPFFQYEMTHLQYCNISLLEQKPQLLVLMTKQRDILT
jgi:hypothetical protein